MGMKTVTLHYPGLLTSFALSSGDRDQILAGVEYNSGFYEPHIMNVLTHIVQPDWVCMDIGANIGAISLAMSYRASGGGVVFAFEPSAENFRYLSLNVRQNKAGNIIPLKLGVYEENKNMAFSFIDFGGGWSHLTTEHAERGIQETIVCVKLDDWAVERGLGRLDLIKLDVEGAEVPALKGAEGLIRGFRPDLIVEFNPGAQQTIFKEDPSLLYRKLMELYPSLYVIDFNYTVQQLHSYEQLMNYFRDGREVVDLYCTYK